MPQEDLIRDDALLIGIAGGDAEALMGLFDAYADVVLALCHHIIGHAHEAQELVCEVFVDVWRGAGSRSAHDGTTRSWLLLNARRLALDLLQKHPELAIQHESEHFQETPLTAVSDAKRVAERSRAQRAVEALSPRTAAVLDLSYFRGMSQGDIAAQLRLSRPLVAKALQDAGSVLQTHLGKETHTAVRGHVGHSLLAHLLGGLAVSRSAQVSAHLSTCDACRVARTEMCDLLSQLAIGLHGLVVPHMLRESLRHAISEVSRFSDFIDALVRGLHLRRGDIENVLDNLDRDTAWQPTPSPGQQQYVVHAEARFVRVMPGQAVNLQDASTPKVRGLIMQGSLCDATGATFTPGRRVTLRSDLSTQYVTQAGPQFICLLTAR